MKKPVKIILIVLGSFVGLSLAFLLWVGGGADDTETIVPAEVQQVSNISVADNGLAVYENDGLEVEVVSADATEEAEVLADESKGELVQGTTKDGKEFTGRGDTIYVANGKETVKATVKTNEKNLDAGKIAGVVSAVTTSSGYSKDNDNWNHDYSVYYIEAAECLLYYPSQLKLKKAEEDSSLTFTDSRSNATLKVRLTENEYSSMDEVEEELVTSSGTQVLASGTDWYSVETYSESNGTKYTMFSMVGLGNKYEVDADLLYEDKYNFVFDELAGLIKCKFINDGVWVSNAKSDTTGKVVKAIAADPEEYWPTLRNTSWYFEGWDCVLYYPDIFTKAYTADNGAEIFTDPKTGAYIMFGKYSAGDIKTQADLQKNLMERYDMTESDLEGEYGCRGKNDTTFVYGILRDGYKYIVELDFDEEFAYSYENAYKMLSIALPGDSISGTEMQDIYYNDYSCCVTIPLQFKEYKADGEVYLYKDSFSGLEMRLVFSEIVDKSDCENLYNHFDVKAKDSDVIYGEYYVKWHNSDGAFIGAVGDRYSCLIEMSYPNAYSVYENCWKRFNISFSDEEEYETEGDKVREEVDDIMAKSDPGDMSDPGDTNDKNTVTGSDPGDMSDPGDTNDKDTVSGKSDPGDMSDPGDTEDKKTSSNQSDPGDMSDPGDTEDKKTTSNQSDPGDMSDPGDTVNEFKMKEKVDSTYEMLMSTDYSVYPELPLAEIEDPVEDSCLCGEVNYISYEDSGTTYNELLGYIDSMYDMGFKCVEKSSDDWDASWVLRCDRGTHGMPGMYMYINADKDMDYVSVLYFYTEETMGYKPGVFNLDYSTIGTKVGDYAHYLSVFFDYGFPDWWYDRETSYYCLSMMKLTYTYSVWDGDYTVTDYYPVLEFGKYSNGKFKAEHIYFYAEADGFLYEVNSNGSTTLVWDGD